MEDVKFLKSDKQLLCTPRVMYSFFKFISQLRRIFHTNFRIPHHLVLITQHALTTIKGSIIRQKTEFEIYFYVQLPLGQPQDLVWLPMEYFGCPSRPLSPVQSKIVLKH